jgi:hypothetical protein
MDGTTATEPKPPVASRRLGGRELLAAWELAELHPIDGALGALALASPGLAHSELTRLTLGERDVALLRLRRDTLGDGLEARGTCPACGTEVEVSLSCDALTAHVTTPPREWLLRSDGYEIRLRPLDSSDAAVAALADDPTEARAVLLRRAVVSAAYGGRSIEADGLPPDVVAAVAEDLAQHDSAAEILLEFACPSCPTTWSDVLDVAGFVIAEIAASGRRLLSDVDRLARAYGWSEDEVLALGDRRRTAYVAMVEA